MWRWSPSEVIRPLIFWVFSTYVEVIPNRCWPWCFALGILHVCGGDPVIHWPKKLKWPYSPRMWRWSYYFRNQFTRWLVFSTYVEVILTFSLWSASLLCILHVCGGDPVRNCELLIGLFVFSTYVEVILDSARKKVPLWRILHVCGGDPHHE